MKGRVLGNLAMLLGVGLIVFQFAAYGIVPSEPAAPVETADVGIQEKLRDDVEVRVAERVVKLPEDGGAWYLQIYTNDDWQARGQDRQLVAAFESLPELQSLRVQTHYHHLTPRSKLYSRYSGALQALPAVTLQSADGTIIYKACGANIPQDSWRIIDDIREALQERFPNLCPGPNCPQPTPSPVVTPLPSPNVGIPDVLAKKPTESGGDDSLPVAGGAGVLSLLAGVAYAWRKQHG